VRQTAEAAAADRRKVLLPPPSPFPPLRMSARRFSLPRSEKKPKFGRRVCRRRYIRVMRGRACFFLLSKLLNSRLQLRRANELGGANAERDSEIRRALGEERCVQTLAAAALRFFCY
jgi:hypothetical protein